jgi:drug/metabolite transporter (DMT)-like permease
METYTLLPIGMTMLGATLTSLGYNVQKVVHVRASVLPTTKKPLYVIQPIWIAGFLIFLSGQIMNMLSLGYASQPLVATVSSFQLVTNAVFAHLIFQERFGRMDFIATIMILFGSLGAVLSIPDPLSPNYTVGDLQQLSWAPSFIGWLAGVVILIVGLLAVLKLSSSYVSSKRSHLSAFEFLIFHVSDNLVFVYALLAAALGSVVQLLAKGTMQLLRLTFDGETQLEFVSTWVLIVCLLVCAITNVHFLNLALREADSLTVIPTYFVLNTALTVVGGLIFFETYHQFSTRSFSLFISSVLFTLCGVLVITKQKLPYPVPSWGNSHVLTYSRRASDSIIVADLSPDELRKYQESGFSFDRTGGTDPSHSYDEESLIMDPHLWHESYQAMSSESDH